MLSIGLGDVWERNVLSNEEAKEWKGILRIKIGAREVREWKDRMNNKPKLRTYVRLKEKLKFENYLKTNDRKGREIQTRLRGGTNELRIETGRYPITNRDRKLDERERR